MELKRRRLTNRLPSERFFERKTPRQRLRIAQHQQFAQEALEKPLLEEMHKLPEWWKKEKQLSSQNIQRGDKTIGYITGRETREVEQKIRSLDPLERAWAEERLKSHFDQSAAHSILRYFEIKPQSPYSFEQVYRRVAKRFPAFVNQVTERGFPAASSLLNFWIRVQDKSGQKKTREFERNNLGKTFQLGWEGVRRRKMRLRFLEPAKMEQFPHVERKGIDEMIEEINLTPREIAILRMRNNENLSYEEIGRVFQISHERVRQIENTATGVIRRRMTPGVSEAEFLRENVGKEFSSTELEITLWGGSEPNSIKLRLKTLIRLGQIALVRKGTGSRPAVYRITEAPLLEILPTSEKSPASSKRAKPSTIRHQKRIARNIERETVTMHVAHELARRPDKWYTATEIRRFIIRGAEQLTWIPKMEKIFPQLARYGRLTRRISNGRTVYRFTPR
jgi:predicted DNA-binding protein (UPF0251 family)